MKLKPLHDNLIVEPIEEEAYTKAGIVLPQTADKEKPEKGKVVAAGPGKYDTTGKLIPMSVREGQKVVFKKYSPDEFEITKDKKVLILAESDVLAIIEE